MWGEVREEGEGSNRYGTVEGRLLGGEGGKQQGRKLRTVVCFYALLTQPWFDVFLINSFAHIVRLRFSGLCLYNTKVFACTILRSLLVQY